MAELLLVTVSAGTLEMVALTEKLPAWSATMGKPRLVLAPAAILARLQVMACAVLAVPDAMLQPAGRLVPAMRKPTGSVMVSVPLAALLPPRLLMATSSVLGVLTVRAVTPPRLGVRSAGGGVAAVRTKAAVLLLVTFSPATAVMAALMV